MRACAVVALHNACMSRCISLQEYLRSTLIDAASRPDPAVVNGLAPRTQGAEGHLPPVRQHAFAQTWKSSAVAHGPTT